MNNYTSRQLAGRLIMVRITVTQLMPPPAAFCSKMLRGACPFRNNMTNQAQLSRLNADLLAAGPAP